MQSQTVAKLTFCWANGRLVAPVKVPKMGGWGRCLVHAEGGKGFQFNCRNWLNFGIQHFRWQTKLSWVGLNHHPRCDIVRRRKESASLFKFPVKLAIRKSSPFFLASIVVVGDGADGDGASRSNFRADN